MAAFSLKIFLMINFFPFYRLLTLLSLLIYQVSFAQNALKILDNKNLKEELDNYIIEYKKIKNIPSISAGILMKGKIFWLGTTGYSDVENMILANPKTVYRIASISKPITAVAIMQLVEKGKIKLDDDVRKYIPYFPQKKWKFTIRQLLNHTSGIRNYRTAEEFDSKTHFNSTREAISVVMDDPLSFQPGTKFLYTTLGYNLLAAVLESVTQMNYDAYLKKNIFEPAGMTSTFTEVQKEIIHHRAHGYVKDEYRELENAPLADLSIKYAGGGLISTAEDLLKFADGLITGKLITPAFLDTMLTPTKLSNGKIIFYGLGFSSGITEYGDQFFSHAGNGTGFSSSFIVFPRSGIAVTCLQNIKDRNPEDPALQLALLAMGKKYQKPKFSLADSLLHLTLRTNIDSAIDYCRSLKNEEVNFFTLNKDELFLFGSDLLKINKSSEAVIFLKFITPKYPNDSQALTALANAYYEGGNKGLALKNYRDVLKIDPENNFAKKMVDKLKSN
jgi:serine beta-lactamase-like protein LACTB, mitochondrial